jgi:hypothetical protein
MIPTTNRPTVQVGVPNECPIQADFRPDIDLRFQFGEPACGVEVTFERLALERFLHLAVDLLAAPWPDGEPGETPLVMVRSVTHDTDDPDHEPPVLTVAGS